MILSLIAQKQDVVHHEMIYQYLKKKVIKIYILKVKCPVCDRGEQTCL